MPGRRSLAWGASGSRGPSGGEDIRMKCYVLTRAFVRTYVRGKRRLSIRQLAAAVHEVHCCLATKEWLLAIDFLCLLVSWRFCSCRIHMQLSGNLITDSVLIFSHFDSAVVGVMVFEQSGQAIQGYRARQMLRHTPPVVDFGAGLGVPGIAQRKW